MILGRYIFTSSCVMWYTNLKMFLNFVVLERLLRKWFWYPMVVIVGYPIPIQSHISKIPVLMFLNVLGPIHPTIGPNKFKFSPRRPKSLLLVSVRLGSYMSFFLVPWWRTKKKKKNYNPKLKGSYVCFSRSHDEGQRKRKRTLVQS